MEKKVFKCGLAGFTSLILVSVMVFGTPTTAPTQTKAPAGQIVWKMDVMWPPGDPETIVLEQAAKDILEFSGGRLKIEVYPGYSLKLNPTRACSNMRDGLTEIANVWVQLAEGQEPSFTLSEITGIWDTKEQQSKVVEALIPFKKKVYKEVWNSHYITTKYMMVQLGGEFSNTRPLRTLDDYKGFKLRVPSARQQAIFKAIGAAPQTMKLGDVYMALKTGVIDGVSSGSRSLIYSKWHEVLKYGTEDRIPDAGAQDIVVSSKAWDPLPKDLKELVTTVFEAVHQRTRVMAVNPGTSNYFRKAAEEKGIEYFDLPAEDRARLREVAWKVQDDFLEKTTPRTLEAWKLVKPILGR